jgi:hypothetical protein
MRTELGPDAIQVHDNVYNQKKACCARLRASALPREPLQPEKLPASRTGVERDMFSAGYIYALGFSLAQLWN